MTHRKDDEAIEALIKRGSPNSPIHPFPQMEEILKRKLGSSEEAV